MANPDSQVTTLDEAPPVMTSKVLTKAKAMAEPIVDATSPGEEFFMVTVHPTGDELGAEVVDVGVNGYLTRIPRGVPVRVNKSVLHVLQNAILTTFKINGDQVIERNTPRFPFSFVAA